MKAKELLERLEQVFPPSFAAPWDNVGLQAGRREKEIKKVFVALDATDEIIGQAILSGADLLLTHHPMLMSGIKKVNTDDLVGRRLVKLIQNDILCYSLHTNYDVLKMASLSGEYMNLQDPEILEVTYHNEQNKRTEGFGRVGTFVKPMTLGALGAYVKEVFQLESVKIFGDLDQIIHTAAISPGSGKSMIMPAVCSKAQVLISGDIGHHEGIDAVDQALAVIDAGHYGVEHIFIKDMGDYLAKEFPGIEVEKEVIRNPFSVR